MRHLGGHLFEVHSAGTRPAGFVHPLATTVLEEAGVSTEGLRSKGLDEFGERTFDYVVTVCSAADAECPTLRGTDDTFKWHAEDPAALAEDENVAMAKAREVRDMFKEKILEMIEGEAAN